MARILDWIKNHVLLTVLIILGLFFLPLILVHVAYKITAISPWFASTWEAGEMIAYIAGFEAFIGTVFLGVVAVHQNDKANDTNSRLVDIEEKNSILERSPNLEILPQKTKILRSSSIPDNRFIVFCSRETASTFSIDEELKKDYYLYTLKIINHSSHSFNIRLIKLYMTSNFDDTTTLDFVSVPHEFSILSQDLPSGREDYIGFILSASEIGDACLYRGTISLLAVNRAHEEFTYTIGLYVGGMQDLKYCQLFMSEITNNN